MVAHLHNDSAGAGVMAVFLTPNLGVSTVLSSSFYAIFNLFAGFAINPPSIPGWWIWVCPPPPQQAFTAADGNMVLQITPHMPQLQNSQKAQGASRPGLS